MNCFFAHHTIPRPFFQTECEKDWLPNAVQQAGWELQIKEMLGANEKDQFVLTEDHVSANFCALFSTYVDLIRETGKTHLLSPIGEHPSITQGIQRLEKFEVQGKMLPLNSQGQLTRSTLDEHLRARSAMLSLSWAHDLTGVVQPIYELYQVCQAKEVRLHIDITHALGKLFFQEQFDLLTFDGAFLGASHGTGALIARSGVTVNGFGQSSAASGRLALLSAGISRGIDQLDQMALEVGRLRDFFEKEVARALPQCKLFFTEVERLPNVAVIAFPGAHAKLLQFALQRLGVWVTEGEGRLAEILKACGVEPTIAHSALSFAFSTLTTQEEIEKGLKWVAETALSLMAMSEGVLCC